MQQIGRLLDRAEAGVGGLLVLVGPAGAGKSALLESAAGEARCRGFDVLRASPAWGQPGRLVWAQLLRDAGAPDGLAAALVSASAGPLELDSAVRHLVSASPRLILVDDFERGGQDAVEVLSVIAARCAAAATAVIVATAAPVGRGAELRLHGLNEADLAAAVGGLEPDAAHALWVASRGLPGVALPLAHELASLPEDQDPVVHLALRATSKARFLDVDANLVRLLEAAVGRAGSDEARARVLASLARELLGDAAAAARRRALVDEALQLARRGGDPGTLAEVLDARLHALWDPEGAEDRLAAGSEILDLARAAADDRRERQGQFWRFVALMELGRVAEAESALAAFGREVAAAGDAEGAVLVASRHAMLAVLRGRFDQASQLADDVASKARQARIADSEAVTATVAASLAAERGPRTFMEAGLEQVLAGAEMLPGHLYEATAARILVLLGRTADAATELERVLPQALASSGPRWLGAMTDLAVAAAAADDTTAAAQIHEALSPYRQRLVIWGGAVTAWGPVSHYLGLLAAVLGKTGDAVGHFEAAIDTERKIGALPYLAHSLCGLADAVASRDDPGDAAMASEHRRRAREIAERLGMTLLLERLGPPADVWTLARDGEVWVLDAGGEHARLRDSRGLHYLRALLAAPGKDIRALDLVAGGAGLPGSGIGPVLDATARDAYRARVADLTESLDAADRAGDRLAAERAEAERQALLAELRRSAGLGGRDRVVAPEAERARVNATRTLRAAIERVAATAPRTAAHLRASIRTGGACRYDPIPGGPSRWQL